MTALPQVNIFNSANGEVASTRALPQVFLAPVRSDVVQFVHTNINKNKRQAYAVAPEAGHQHSAESWGTGRAVSRIPRVSGGGTHRAGQGAFGNMCRKGRMFAPTKTWRKWHRKVNVKQRRTATAAAIAASAVTPLVQARGHRVSRIPALPLVISDDINQVAKTRDAVALLSRFGLDEDVERVKSSRKIRVGKGKMRDRRYVQRRGPLVVYKGQQDGLTRAFRNIPGVDLCEVSRLNLLQLTPGSHLGRLIVWTDAAFAALDGIWSGKSNYAMPRSLMSNADIGRIINSDEVQAVVRPAREAPRRPRRKRNPLKNTQEMARLNPYIHQYRKTSQQKRSSAKQARRK